jgi:predicted alpha/beta-hydrolase family hydrolase
MAGFIFDGPEGADLALLLAHGAGAPMDSPFMNRVASGVARHGTRVARFEFPYMAKRREDGRKRSPDPTSALLSAFRSAIASFDSARLVIGGKSLGGRIASMIAPTSGVRGVVCLGYPFHPPGNPGRPRTEHLRDLSVPTLIVQGARDPFGAPAEVASYALSPAIRLHWIEDGDHGLVPRKRSGRSESGNLDEAVAVVASFLAEIRSMAGNRHERG